MAGTRERGRPPHPDILTPAEWRVAEAIRHGLSNAAIAARQKVTPDAVKYHLANILQKLGLANRRALRNWSGIRRDSQLAQKEFTMTDNPALGAIGQIARSVKDIEAATAWYKDVLGLTHLYSFGTLSFFDCGGVRLFLSQGETQTAESILYFRVDDVRPAAAALKARGVEFLNAPHLVHRHGDGTEEWMAFFNDHEGRPLALMAQIKMTDAQK